MSFGRHVLATLVAAAAVCTLNAAHYYVDANNGNDANSGAQGSPRRTLQGAMGISGLADGDVVHAAAGTYREGGASYGNVGKSRVVITRKILLVADEGAGKTFIEGQKSAEATTGHGSDSMRCAYFAVAGVIKGFTLTNGYVTAGLSGNLGNGGGVSGGGLCVECRFVQNRALNRGGAASGATLLRCYVGQQLGSYGVYSGVNLIDSEYDCTLSAYSHIWAYNTTFVRGTVSGSTTAYENAYNCLFLSTSQSMYYANLYNCYVVLGQGTGVVDKDGNSKFNVPLSDLPYDDATMRPVVGSIAIDSGINAYYAQATNNWSALWMQHVGKDYAGGPRIQNGRIDVGAGENDPNDHVLSIIDAQGALHVTGAEKGSTVLHEGESRTFTVSRDFSTQMLLTGVRVNGEFFTFTGESEELTHTFTYGYDDPQTAFVVMAVYAEHNDWYVNASAPNDDANGRTPYLARRTLMGGMALAKSGDTVHAAPGVYDEGAGNAANTGSNRVYVTAGVMLVGDRGAGVTTIKGKRSEYAANGCSTNSLRCVELANGAVIKGFTLTDGYAPTCFNGTYIANENNRVGGAIRGGLAVECVITNCCSASRGVIVSTTLLRCYVGPNTADNGCYMSVSMIDCVYDFTKTAYSIVRAYNTMFLKGYIEGNNNSQVNAYNSLFFGASPRYCNLYNCHGTEAMGAGSVDKDGLSRSGVDAAEYAYDAATYRPLAGSRSLDAGVNDYYAMATNGWSALWMRQLGKDYAGGQRVYNVTVDIGPGEYDWRGVYTRAITTRTDQMNVDLASPGVTTNAVGQLTLGSGDRLGIVVSLLTGGMVTFRMSSPLGEDTITFTVDGVEVPASGAVVYSCPVAEGEHEVVITYSGEGSATLVSIALPQRGLVIGINGHM